MLFNDQMLKFLLLESEYTGNYVRSIVDGLIRAQSRQYIRMLGVEGEGNK